MSHTHAVHIRPRPPWQMEATLLFLECLRFIVRPRTFPRFSLRERGGGMLGWIRAGTRLGLTRQAMFRGRVHYAPIVPGVPSAPFRHLAANGGMNIDAAGTRWKPGIDLAILAITRRCPLACTQCYARGITSVPEAVGAEEWFETICALQRIGTGIIAFSGGEPMMRYDDLLWLLANVDHSASEFHLYTSGMGVTAERARELAQEGLTAAAVGIDDADEERHDRLRGQRGSFRQAVRAVGWFHDAGILPYLNLCLTRELVRSGGLWHYFAMAKELNVAYIQMLEPRPVGGSPGHADDALLTHEDRDAVSRFFTATQNTRVYPDHPIVYSVAHAEAPQQMGCRMGGLSHLAIDGEGNVSPCVFLPVGFGNIRTESFESIYARMRAVIRKPIRTECPSLTLGPAIRDACAGGAATPVPYEGIRASFDAALTARSDGVVRS